MKNKRIILTIIICLFPLLFNFLYTSWLSSTQCPNATFKTHETKIIVISFIISYFSFVISMLAFFVIDSLRAITSMEGNVLENENYSIAYEEVVDNFAECKTQQQFTDKLFEIVMPNKRIHSCMKFADELQTIVEYLIWFAYIDYKDKKVMEKRDKLCKIIENKKNHFEKLNNGIKHLLNEYVKLIQYVLGYQQNRNTEENGRIVKLENVRGEMLRNPVAKIVYYDYLGLHYRRKSLTILEECVYKKPDLTPDFMNAVKEHSFERKSLDNYHCLASLSKEYFSKAQSLSQNNFLWSSYISYNTLRIDLMNHLVTKELDHNQMIDQIEHVIKTRKNLHFILTRDDSYLDEMFLREVERSIILKQAFCEIQK